MAALHRSGLADSLWEMGLSWCRHWETRLRVMGSRERGLTSK